MKTIIQRMCAISFVFLSLASTSTWAVESTYKNYKALVASLNNEQAVIDFIDENNYLSDRLRKKWLTHLAKQKQWQQYLNFYQPTGNITRQCYYLQALYHNDQQAKAFKHIKKIWLSGDSRPSACDPIFKAWFKDETFTDQLVWQRIELAIKKRNYGLAHHLRKHLSQSDTRLLKTWLKLSKAPYKLWQTELPAHEISATIIVDVIKKWVRRDMDSAIDYWQSVQAHQSFSKAQKQEIYQTLALFAAMRNRSDAAHFFNQLIPELTPHKFYEWRVRSALQQNRWQDVAQYIQSMPEKLQQKPCWQYWLARAYDKTDRQSLSQPIYQALSQKRHYYGFLASHRAKLPINMSEQDYQYPTEHLIDHASKINYINQLYKKGNIDKASLVSYELANDLPKAGQYQLAKTYAEWQWHDKALMLANASKHHDALSLRFPLAYQGIINQHAQTYNIAPAFIYAIIRQESTFRKKVKSSAGALGLMQVIPSTARKVARQHRIRLRNMKQMYQPPKNIEIGTAYLHNLSKRFDGHPVLMAAAYNAGPKQVNYWLRKFPKNETDIWVETLPWHETRNYLKNIISFYAVYQHRLNKNISLKKALQPLE